MGFLDNLENNLKQLESRDENTAMEDHRKRETERARAQAAAPYVEKLKSGDFTDRLLSEATRIGHGLRTKVRPVWLPGGVLRLEARNRKLELRPTPAGVFAAFIEDDREVRSEKVDLDGNPAGLAQQWLSM